MKCALSFTHQGSYEVLPFTCEPKVNDGEQGPSDDEQSKRCLTVHSHVGDKIPELIPLSVLSSCRLHLPPATRRLSTRPHRLSGIKRNQTPRGIPLRHYDVGC